VNNAFLNRDPEEEIYMELPPGYEEMAASGTVQTGKSLIWIKTISQSMVW